MNSRLVTVLTLAMSVCLACTGVYSTTRPSASAEWKLAVVFESDNGGRKYLGRSSNVSGLFSSNAEKIKLSHNRPADRRFYELWLLRDGATLGIWYEPKTAACGVLQRAPAANLPEINCGSLLEIVHGASPTLSAPDLPSGSTVAEPSLAWDAFNLRDLIRESDVVAVGRVEGLWRMANSPIGSTSLMQHTVSLFTVEEYILDRRGGGIPILKINQPGGSLPWKLPDGKTGVGYALRGNPLLRFGERYIVFLQSLDRHPWKRKAPYLEVSFAGVRGKGADWDEYIFPAPMRSKLRIVNQRTTTPIDGVDWQFKEGPQILNKSVPEATALIRAEVASIPK